MSLRATNGTTAGFSLVEVLVAMTLMSMVGIMVAGGIRFGGAAWERTEDAAAASIETRVVTKFLRRQIGAAQHIQVRDGSRNPPVLFDGQPKSIRLAAPVAAHLAPPGLHLVSLDLDQSRAGEHQLAMRWSKLGVKRPEIDRTQTGEPLLRDLGDVSFRYFGVDPQTGTQIFQDAWRGRTNLPQLVEVTLRWRDSSPRSPHRFVIRLAHADGGRS